MKNTPETIDIPAKPPERGMLTRRQVAGELGVSYSTVKRMEGKDLHPVVMENGVRAFEITEVRSIAVTVGPRPPSHTAASEQLSDGEIAARVFECFEARLGLSETVIRTRQTTDVVRKLYRQWRTGLERHLQQRQQAPGRLPTLEPLELEDTLEALPMNVETRLSLARLGDPERDDLCNKIPIFDELPSRIVFGPITVSELFTGPGTYRVTAVRDREILWEGTLTVESDKPRSRGR